VPPVSRDDIAAAVLAREDVAKYLIGSNGESDADARARVESYLQELQTTQRYRFYRALQHPLYPILRKVKRIYEHGEIAAEATARGHVVYVSNHKSHLDYLVELLALDDLGIRPPLIAAGVNLFGGALGLLHRHVTGAIPIRRNSKDPAYLMTLRAYVAEILRHRDLLYYAEGGRSYSGEIKSPKTGLLQAALQADRTRLSVLPMAVSYDLVLEDRLLASQAVKRRSQPFAKEFAEMIRHAVGFRTRAFVTFGQPIPLAEYEPESRRDLVQLAHRIQHDIGLLYKVLPTALVAATVRPHMTRSELAARIDDLLAVLTMQQANVSVKSGRQAVEEGIDPLIERGVLVAARQQLRVRDRIVLRYYARTIEHLVTVAPAPRRTMKRAIH
jgi:glycerol-3-phosphate O-acyltransferase